VILEVKWDNKIACGNGYYIHALDITYMHISLLQCCMHGEGRERALKERR
jgi:hypothetical protein